MTDEFCTYFDHRYAAKGLAMWRSLKQRRANTILHVLCLTEACREILAGLTLPDVHLHSLNALEESNADLLRAKGNRSLVEYYFTLTPCLPLYIFGLCPQVSRLTYVDADLFFFADPQPILEELGDNSVGLIEHRFPDRLADLAKHGRFNVGWLTFTNDPIARGCLETWRAQCIEWCYDRVEPGRFAEQKYLDEWPDRSARIRIIQHRGANVAPWNLDRFELSLDGEELRVGGHPLLFFHAHGFEPAAASRPRVLNLEAYGVEETPLLHRAIFDTYEQALIDATTEIATPLAFALLSDPPRGGEFLRETLAASEADRAARLDVIHMLQRQLEASEADRAARLNVIHTMQRQLEASEADRAARLDVIHTTQRQLEASEADRAARLDVIRTLQGQLEVSEADRAARLGVIQAVQNRLQASEADLAAVRTQLAHSRSRVDAMELSRSWRWTRPLRWAAGLLKKRNGEI